MILTPPSSQEGDGRVPLPQKGEGEFRSKLFIQGTRIIPRTARSTPYYMRIEGPLKDNWPIPSLRARIFLTQSLSDLLVTQPKVLSSTLMLKTHCIALHCTAPFALSQQLQTGEFDQPSRRPWDHETLGLSKIR